MIPIESMSVQNVSDPTVSQFLASNPDAIITTYPDLALVVLVVGLVALALGYVAGIRRRG